MSCRKSVERPCRVRAEQHFFCHICLILKDLFWNAGRRSGLRAGFQGVARALAVTNIASVLTDKRRPPRMMVRSNRWRRFHQDDEQEIKGAWKKTGGDKLPPLFLPAGKCQRRRTDDRASGLMVHCGSTGDA